MNKNKKISFCVTSCNRLWQLKNTLEKNLISINNDHEISLVDYGSSDGISQWVWNNFSDYIDSGKLVFFEVKSNTTWNVSKAKNLAHRISSGQYLFNLDADNFISDSDIKSILDAKIKGFACHQWSKIIKDGSHGRIGLPREIFYKLGGYDETLLPMGGQDGDLLRRLISIGCRIVKLSPPELVAIQNSIEDSVSEFNKNNLDAQSLYGKMNQLNFFKSRLRLKIEGPIIAGGFSSYTGLLNGVKVTINGFDSINIVP